MSKDKFVNICGRVVFFIWFLLVLQITIFSRNTSPQLSAELTLFWCIKDAWLNKNSVNWYFVIGNIFLFIPFGLIFAIFFRTMRKLWKISIGAFILSLSIETIQLIFRKGLFELDDLFNNVIGAIIGYGLVVLMIASRDRKNISRIDKWIATFILITFIIFIIVALMVGQPVFDYFLSVGFSISN